MKEFEIKETMNEQMILIKNYYSKAMGYIHNNNYKSATRVLYNEMPFDLYDMSLNILFNRNDIFSDEELKLLIQNVDDKLVEYSTVNKEEELPEDEITIIF